MYAKIASTAFEDVNEFVAWAIKGMKAKHGMPKEKIASGKTLHFQPKPLSKSYGTYSVSWRPEASVRSTAALISSSAPLSHSYLTVAVPLASPLLV